MTKEQTDPVVIELRKIANLLALSATREMKKNEAAVLLAQAGFAAADSAALLGTSDASVRAMLSQARSKSSAKAAPPLVGD